MEQEPLKQNRPSLIVPRHVRPSLPRMLVSIALRPRATFRAAREGKWFDFRLALVFLLAYSAVEAATWVWSGMSRGGNPLKFFYVGDALPDRLLLIRRLDPAAQFVLLFAAKVGADLGIMTVTHHFATRRLKAPRGSFKEWFATYGYILAVLDLYFILAGAVAIVPGPRALAASHILLAFTLTWILLVYTWAYADTYGLDDDSAYRYFWVIFLAIPVAFLAPGMVLIP